MARWASRSIGTRLSTASGSRRRLRSTGPQRQQPPAQRSQGYVTDKNFVNPRTYTWALTVEQALTDTMKFSASFNYAKGVHGSRFVNHNDSGIRFSVEHRLGGRQD